MTDLSDVRKEYGLSRLDRDTLAADPIEQFDRWYQDASKTISEANAMILATAYQGRTSQRLLLLKSYDHDGFVFYTNYSSRKAAEIEHNPQGSLLFWWKSIERQVRIEGRIEKVDAAMSDQYFASRSRDAQLGAIASKQSQVIPDRKALEDEYQRCKDAHPGHIQRPAFWGGYRLIPDYYEFWQGGANRLHDRFCYRPDNQHWLIQRLAP